MGMPAKLAAPNTSRTAAIAQSASVKPRPMPRPSSADLPTEFLLANISALPRIMQFTPVKPDAAGVRGILERVTGHG